VLLLTNDMILEDIKNYEKRIRDAKAKLSDMPETAGTWKGQKKVNHKKKILQDEIKHIKRLVLIAEEALIDV
jgi:hypothetical protein